MKSSLHFEAQITTRIVLVLVLFVLFSVLEASFAAAANIYTVTWRALRLRAWLLSRSG